MCLDLLLMSRKRLVCDILDTFASHAGLRMRSLIHSGAPCTQNGSTHDSVFATFKRRDLLKRTRK